MIGGKEGPLMLFIVVESDQTALARPSAIDVLLAARDARARATRQRGCEAFSAESVVIESRANRLHRGAALSMLRKASFVILKAKG